MKNKFKVGDRAIGYIYDDGATTGEVVAVSDKDGRVVIKCDEDEEEHIFHYKQCRRLKPKRKARSVEGFMNRSVFTRPDWNREGSYCFWDKDLSQNNEYLKVRITEVIE